MSDRQTEVDVDDLAEEFARRLRAGERPTVEEYAARHPEQADEIREVLAAVEVMERHKPRPASPPTPAPAAAPERLGDYRILREIGRGGMGVVYEAEQVSLGRRVAVKVLPAHLLSDERSRARFRREAQAAAKLHHTNVVPVFGVGECGGLCFYVMQLIDGCSLDRLLRGGSVEPPPNEASTLVRGRSHTPDQAVAAPAQQWQPLPGGFRAAARIAAQAAEALAYAHSQGVLHRDVKPANLLLDRDGAVWVTDFGVAKLLQEPGLTGTGDLVGTLRYVPPERFAGRTDERGDVYSLGVTLYEMLTRRAAFPDTTPSHLIHLITTRPLPPVRRHDPAIPADLETVVLKATASDPAHRYQSAADLADDLRCFLDDRPIRARPVGPAERAWRWCRRNPGLATSGAAVVLLMAAVTVVSAVGYVRTSAANAEAEKALAAERAERRQAEETASLALAALNRTFDRFAPARLVATAQSGEGVEAPQPSLSPEAAALLEDLLRTYEEVARAAGKYPRLQAQAAEANHRIGDVHQRLGRHEQAAAAYRAAIELYENLPEDQATGEARIKLARSRNDLGRTLRVLRRMDDSARMHRLAIQGLSEAPPTLAARPECRFEMARAYYLLGLRDVLDEKGPPGKGPHRKGPHGKGPHDRKKDGKKDRPPPDDEERDSPGRHAAGLLEGLVKEYDRVPEYRHLLACCYRDLRPGPRRGGQEEGGPGRAVELLRKLADDFPHVPDFRLDLCDALERQSPPGPDQDFQQRSKHLGEAIEIARKLAADYPSVPEYAAAHARYLDLLGVATIESGDAAGAEKLHRQAIATQARLVKQCPDVVAYAFWLCRMERSLGRALAERGELKEGKAWLRSAIDRAEGLLKKDPDLANVRPLLGMAYRELAQALSRGGETALADQARRKAEEYGGPGGPRKRDERRP
jgi:serine/threonine protein kinase/tetratricopeptide (TPR) repeat protein